MRTKMGRLMGVFVLAVVLSAGLLACGKKDAPPKVQTGTDAGATQEQKVAQEPQEAEPDEGKDPQAVAQEVAQENGPADVSVYFEIVDVTCRTGGIAVMEDGAFLVTDIYNKVIWKVEDGVSTVFAGGETVRDAYGEPLGGYNDADQKKSYFSCPWAIAPFLDGWAVSDTENNAIRLIKEGEVQTINGKTTERLKIGKLGVIFNHPTGLTADGDGNLYVADTNNGAVRRISKEGNVITVVDGLQGPTGLCWDKDALYIAETNANRILKCTNGKVEVVAGSGEDDFADGAVTDAAFAYPQGVVVGDDGAVYVADTGNSAVRKIKDGMVTTLLLRERTLLEMDPISPVGMTIQGNELYVCDAFTGKVFQIGLK